MLPLSMVAIPVTFYLILFANGMSIADAREGGWVGEVSLMESLKIKLVQSYI